ncbi:GNAT family N-acetyltransferase [Chitinophaga filiformis]|uniref:GNAT family N-acetyltransferase n=1 Tax=Chitinophaga filiformis TaxID=104663 RepID=UPI001F31E466|nr:GNAT family N-acetyltransferase [Chitinophaga filiformis]MCF6406962.1 GNAT family N-acetyltransferase [Chitinophaga filiformis]
MEKIIIRPIQPSDNKHIARIIREVLTEFKANKPGTAYFDTSLDELHSLFTYPHAAYWVLEQDGHIIGGAGIYPTNGLPPHYCELVKLYLLPAARGKGLGKQLIQQCFDAAIENGCTHMYLETMPELTSAIPLYEKMGFAYLPQALGASGHFGCSVWMLKAL